jgi:hypothetical protein
LLETGPVEYRCSVYGFLWMPSCLRPGLWPGGRSRLKRAYRLGFDPRFSCLSEAGAKGPLIIKKTENQQIIMGN